MRFVKTKQTLPYYCEVEYLEGSGTQWIDMGLIIPQNAKAEFKFKLTSTNDKQAVFGSTSGNNGFFFGTAANGQVYCNNTGLVITPVITLSVNTDYTVSQDREKVFINGSEYTTNAGGTNNFSAALFARKVSDIAAERYITGRIYYFRLYNNNNLICDFIPALDWDMTPCMYDRVSGQLFYNRGTGSFTYGRQIHYVDYLTGQDSAGKTYIDTGFKPTTNTKVRCIVASEQMGLNKNITYYGSRTGATAATNFALINYQTTGKLRFDRGAYMASGNSDVVYSDTFYEIVQDKNNNYVDGVKVSESNGAFSNVDYPIYIFGINENGNYLQGGAWAEDKKSFKLFQIYDNDVLIRDYLPAIDENGVGFMFDKVEHKIYDNAGNGAFTYPDVELEYLDSSGTQYINTGYCPKSKTVLKEKLRSFSSISAALSFTRWSASPTYDTFATYWTQPSGFNFYYGRYSNGKYLGSGALLDTDYEVEIGLTSITINGTSTTITRGTDEWTNTSYPLYLFCGNNIGTASFFSSSRKYYFQIIEDGVLILDYVPVIHNGVFCMYDRVSQTYKTNAGTGKFTGKIKVKPSKTALYLVKDGTTKKTRLIEE